MPNEMVMIRQPAARTTSGVRQDFSMQCSLADERFSSRVHFACEGFLLLIRYNIATGELPEEVARDPGRESGHENDQQQHQALGAENVQTWRLVSSSVVCAMLVVTKSSGAVGGETAPIWLQITITRPIWIGSMP